jgi:hypothetical protein
LCFIKGSGIARNAPNNYDRFFASVLLVAVARTKGKSSRTICCFEICTINELKLGNFLTAWKKPLF